MVTEQALTEQYGPMPFELLEVEGAVNVRDLGGYMGRDGMLIMPRRFVRAGSLAGLTEAGLNALADMGIDTVIDLRSRFEAERMPSRILDDHRFVYHHVPMLDYINSTLADPSAENKLSFPASMAEMYTGLLDNAGHSFRRVFERLGDPAAKGCLFNCTAGKDRTGMTAMLLLKLAGVDDDTVVEDYRWSERLLEVPLPKNADGIPAYVVESAPETMRAALDHLHSRYGGAASYLERCGVGEELRDRVLAKLFEA